MRNLRKNTLSNPQIVFITPTCPTGPDSGGLQVTLERIEALSQHARVIVVSLQGSENARSYLMSKFGVEEVYWAGELRPRNMHHWLASIFRGVPLSIWRNMPSKFMALCKRLGQYEFTLAYVDHWLMWPAAQQFKHCKNRVLHLHNAEHKLFERAAEGRNVLLRLALLCEAQRVASFLKRACNAVDEVHYLSEIDQTLVSNLGLRGVKEHVFFPSVALAENSSGNFGKRLLFVGTMSWLPNAEGIGWFLKKVRPLLPSDYQVEVAGGGKLTDIIGTESVVPGATINWLGRVPDLEPHYESASVFIAPLLSGSGIKIKILNALSRGLPVVTTSVGIEGFPSGWRNAIRIADSPEEFAKEVDFLCGNHSNWENAADDARHYIAQHFSSKPFLEWSASL